MATRTGMYLNVLECTGIENVLENVLEKSLFLYLKKSVLEKFKEILLMYWNVLENQKYTWLYLKDEIFLVKQKSQKWQAERAFLGS